MAVTFDDLMKGFGIVTVMNACIFIPKKAYFATRNCKTAGQDTSGGMLPEDFVPAYEYIDTLKIANFTMEGPTKTITGGQYINPLVKYGKTMTAEIQDALGRASTLVRFFGAEYDGYAEYIGRGKVVGAGYEYEIPGLAVKDEADLVLVRINGIPVAKDDDNGFKVEDGKVTIAKTWKSPTPTSVEEDGPKAYTATDIFDDDIVQITVPGSRLSITDKYPGPFALEGDTFYIDQKTGEKKHVFFFVPQFLPDSILTLTQDAEGDATVFDLNGSVSVTDVHDTKDQKVRSIFYEIREDSFFKKQRAEMWIPGTDYKDLKAPGGA